MTTKIVGAKISNAVIAAANDPCEGFSIGDSCGGGLYAGTFNGYKYVVTPSGCTNSATPVCDGVSLDGFTLDWANNSGTSAYGVVTGASSTTDGFGNTALLATNYTDTDAAKYCYNMDYGGYTDWFLPAQDELNFFYSNTAAFNYRGSDYWSSTEDTSTKAYDQAMGSGGQGTSFKTFLRYVRCSRKY